MRISIGSDHGGFKLKEAIKDYLNKNNEVIDRGCYSLEPVDYPLYAKSVSLDIVNNKADIGILICTNGIGMSIVANKFMGIRAALVLNKDMAYHARRHNDANVLCLGGGNQTVEDALSFVDTFLFTDFCNVERHKRRVDEINLIEKGE